MTRMHQGRLYDRLKAAEQALFSFQGRLYDALYTGWILRLTAPRPWAGEKWGIQQVPFSALYEHRDGTAGTLRAQADTDPGFGSGDFQEGTAPVTSGQRGTVTLTLNDRGTWYFRMRAESGGEISDWLSGTLERTAFSVNLIDPEGDGPADAAPMTFTVRGYSDDSSTVKAYWETDKVLTFNGPDLEQQSTDFRSSGSEHVFSRTYTGKQTWYWRVRGQSGESYTDWLGGYRLDVDTSGTLPAEIDPVPTAPLEVEAGIYAIPWSALVDHVITPTQAATLRLRVERDDTSEFLSPTTYTSIRMLGGDRAEVDFPVTAAGTYWFRFRTLADYGDNSAWLTYQVTVTLRTQFREEPRWEPQIGPRSNRVFCRIAGGTVIKTAEVPGVPVGQKLDHWVEVPIGTSEADAQSTANAALAMLQARPVSVSGPIILNVTLSFEEKVTAEWWAHNDAGIPVLRDTAVLIIAKKQHDVAAARTTLYLGDYAPPAEEAIARLLAKLSRKG